MRNSIFSHKDKTNPPRILPMRGFNNYNNHPNTVVLPIL